jgi:hypothetical protein
MSILVFFHLYNSFVLHFFLDKITVAQGGVSKAVTSVKEQAAIVTAEKSNLASIGRNKK